MRLRRAEMHPGNDNDMVTLQHRKAESGEAKTDEAKDQHANVQHANDKEAGV